MVRVVGLSGPIACGKSAVSSRMRAAGYALLDADAITHELYAEPGGAIARNLSAAFGEGVLKTDGSVDREKVSEIVFSDPSKFRALNRATHGVISRRMAFRGLLAVLQGYRNILCDVPLFAKFPLARRFLNAMVVVVVPAEVQLRRLMERNGFSEEEARARIAQQPSAEEQARMADVVIDNSGSLEDLDRKVAEVIAQWPRGWSLWEVLLLLLGLAAAACGGHVLLSAL